ncbi:hypothetical protein PFISCL1PPCAC_19544, partial [Pristionchus fissidentatus]
RLCTGVRRMTTLNDSGLGSVVRPNDETPVTSKVQKRPLVRTNGKTPIGSAKKRKLTIDRDRSKWLSFELNVPSDDFLMKETIESESVEIEGSKWSLVVLRRRNDELNTIMMETNVQCVVPSPAWCAKCKIEMEIVTDERTFRKSFDCTITWSSNSRGLALDWRKCFFRGGKITAKLLVTRVCNKYLNFPDFTDPYETGIDELFVGDRPLYVDKSLLSMHSSFFSRLFSTSNGPYRLEGRVEDVVATLQTVYPQKGVIDDSNACTIAVLAKEFEFWETLERCEKFLLGSNKFSIVEKIEASLRCQMHALLSQCSEHLASIDDIMKVIGSKPDGFEASEATKAYLFDLIVPLYKKTTIEEVEV